MLETKRPGYFTPTRHAPLPVSQWQAQPQQHDVVIVGAGPVGMAVALQLARVGVCSLLLEKSDSISIGSRAICVSARSLEILDRCGVLQQVLETALPWTGGRSFYRDKDVLRFEMRAAADHLPPMVNIQQCLLEQILVDRIDREPLIELRWCSTVDGVQHADDHVVIDVATPLGGYSVQAAWVVASDGPRSTVRTMMGLELYGETHEGRFVIVDITMDSERTAERLCWFDPPTFPGKTVLMHKQPLNVWRLDYQIDDDESLESATDPERVLPAVAKHLEWIGESGSWTLEWLSSYRAHSLSLRDYRVGRVLFAGDAAHLVPIFGVRGLNGGFVDACNLAWKLANVLDSADDSLLDNYSCEQRWAALRNIESASASARFMSPSSASAHLVRAAALSLSVSRPEFRTLIDPRQTVPVVYPASELVADDVDMWSAGPPPGSLAPDTRLGDARLDELCGSRFVLLAFGCSPNLPAVDVIGVADPSVASLFDAREGDAYLIRPDRYVAARWRNSAVEDLGSKVSSFLYGAALEGRRRADA